MANPTDPEIHRVNCRCDACELAYWQAFRDVYTPREQRAILASRKARLAAQKGKVSE